MLLMNYVGIGNKLAATSVMPNTTSMSVTPPPCKFRHIQYTYSQHFASRRSEACFVCKNVPKSQATRNQSACCLAFCVFLRGGGDDDLIGFTSASRRQPLRLAQKLVRLVPNRNTKL